MKKIFISIFITINYTSLVWANSNRDLVSTFIQNKQHAIKQCKQRSAQLLKLKKSAAYHQCKRDLFSDPSPLCFSLFPQVQKLMPNLNLTRQLPIKHSRASLYSQLSQKQIQSNLTVEEYLSPSQIRAQCIAKKRPLLVCQIDRLFKYYKGICPQTNQQLISFATALAATPKHCIPRKKNSNNSIFSVIAQVVEQGDKKSSARKNHDDSYYHMTKGQYSKTNIFKITIKNSQEHINRLCTATHIKIDNKCYLLTNEHCIHGANSPKITLSTGANNEPFGRASRDFPLQVVKVDPQAELVLLKAPPIFDRQFCPRIKPTKIQTNKEITQASDNKLIAGYLRRGEVDQTYQYSINSKELKGIKNSCTEVNASLQHVSKFIKCKYLDIASGMSGGAVIGKDGNIDGIVTRYIPYQDTPMFIPIKDIATFVNNKKVVKDKPKHLFPDIELIYVAHGHSSPLKYKKPGDNLPSMPDGDNESSSPSDKRYYQPGDNLPSMPDGDNESSSPSDKRHKMPDGDNEASSPSDKRYYQPGDNLTSMPKDRDPNLKRFSESHEGILDFNDPKKRKLLAVKCNKNSRWEQIDGFDDYAYKCNDVTKLSEQQKIYATEDGHIPPQYRDIFFQQLATNYTQNRKSFGREAVFVADRNGMDGMNKVGVQNQLDSLHYSPSKGEIELQLGKQMLHFKVYKKDHNNHIILEAKSGEKLFCDNKSLMKLICKNKKHILNISIVANNGQQKVNYRYITKQKNSYKYNYGQFYKSLNDK